MERERLGFKAQYTSDCLGCGSQIDKGNVITFVHTERGRVVVHLGCEENALPTGPRHDDSEHVSIAEVMPRGKTAKDKCDRCFMVHSPGQNGCE